MHEVAQSSSVEQRWVFQLADRSRKLTRLNRATNGTIARANADAAAERVQQVPFTARNNNIEAAQPHGASSADSAPPPLPTQAGGVKRGPVDFSGTIQLLAVVYSLLAGFTLNCLFTNQIPDPPQNEINARLAWASSCFIAALLLLLPAQATIQHYAHNMYGRTSPYIFVSCIFYGSAGLFILGTASIATALTSFNQKGPALTIATIGIVTIVPSIYILVRYRPHLTIVPPSNTRV